MGIIKEWFQTSTPVVKMFMALGITTAIYLVHRNWYEPYARKQRYMRAEQWANMIIEQEENESNKNR